MRFSSILLLVLLCAVRTAAGSDDTTAYFLVFLNTNPDRPKIERDSAEGLQQGHLENMDRLYNEGKLVIAGPFADTLSGGIFILKTNTLEEARGLLETDPAITAGRYTIEVFSLRLSDQSSICTASDLFDLVKYPFARLTPQSWMTAEDAREQSAYYQQLARDKRILFRASLGEGGGSIVVFPRSELLDVPKSLLKNDPAIRKASVRQSLRLWYSAPGVFCEEVDQ